MKILYINTVLEPSANSCQPSARSQVTSVKRREPEPGMTNSERRMTNHIRSPKASRSSRPSVPVPHSASRHGPLTHNHSPDQWNLSERRETKYQSAQPVRLCRLRGRNRAQRFLDIQAVRRSQQLRPQRLARIGTSRDVAQRFADSPSPHANSAFRIPRSSAVVATQWHGLQHAQADARVPSDAAECNTLQHATQRGFDLRVFEPNVACRDSGLPEQYGSKMASPPRRSYCPYSPVRFACY
jgi:hypothetical protein